eukprot:UN02414
MKDGGPARFYRGLGAALLQAPLSRFGDTAANVGITHFLNNVSSTSGLPLIVKNFICSLGASFWRIFLMPIDAVKTNLQVNGSLAPLKKKISETGFLSVYDGALMTSFAT